MAPAMQRHVARRADLGTLLPFVERVVSPVRESLGMHRVDLSHVAKAWQSAADADVIRALAAPEDYPHEVFTLIQGEARRRDVRGDGPSQGSQQRLLVKRRLTRPFETAAKECKKRA